MSEQSRKLVVEQVRTVELRAFRGNARTHSPKQIGQIVESIRSFGWMNPILVDDGNNVIAGHGRLEAAKLLGLTHVPVIRIGDLSDAEIRAYRLADNKLAENAGWDDGLLRVELNFLLESTLDFEPTVTGFEMGEIDLIIGSADEEADDADDLEAPDDTGRCVSQRGDLWLAGPHRLLCGDALNPEDHELLMDGEKAELAITDPPYNVKIVGNVSGLGRKRHREFAMASGEMSRDEFIQFLSTAFARMAASSTTGSLHYVFMDWRHTGETVAAGQAVFNELKNICVWDKGHGGMGSLYRSAHELVFVFKNGKAAHINNVALGAYGRNRTNVWRYPSANSFGPGRDEALDMHPTVKPVGMIADAILDGSRRGGIVLDPFAGAGTILIAAHRTGRSARAIEIDPRYVDVALRRYRRISGIDPIHATTGMTFTDAEGAVQSSPDVAGADQ